MNSRNNSLMIMIPFLTVFSCGKSYDLGSEATETITVNTASPTWDNGIGAVFTKKCANCHTSSRSKFVPSNTPTTIDSIANSTFFDTSANATLVYNRLFNDTTASMPPNFATPLSTDEKAAVKSWLATKTESVASICGTSGSSQSTYSRSATTIASDCATCHTAAADRKTFDSLTEIKTMRLPMLSYLNANKMPQGNTTYRSAGNGLALFQWLCFGTEFQ